MINRHHLMLICLSNKKKHMASCRSDELEIENAPNVQDGRLPRRENLEAGAGRQSILSGRPAQREEPGPAGGMEEGRGVKTP